MCTRENMDALFSKLIYRMIHPPLYYKIHIASPPIYFRHAISQLKLALFLIIINPFNIRRG